MSEERSSASTFCWSEALPFVRLFSAFPRAFSLRPLVLCLLGVTACYLVGRVLDAVWVAADRGVLVTPADPHRTEIEAYVALDASRFREWRERNLAAAESSPSAAPAGDLRGVVEQRHSGALAALERNTQLSREERRRMRAELNRDADILLLAIEGYDLRILAGALEVAQAARRLVEADTSLDPAQRSEQLGRLTAAGTQSRTAGPDRARLRGPFIAWYGYEMRCFAAAIQGIFAGRWGASGSALDPQPAAIGSLASAARGVFWAATQRPWYLVLFGLISLLVFSFVGGATCRYAAVQSVREESLPLRTLATFAREKLAGLIGAPLFVAAIFAGTFVLMLIGGLFGAIPVLGEIFSGLLFFLALLGGLALALALVALVLGFPLMWPTIAVEASDAFDAVQRSASYVFQRFFHVAFYSFVLLVYGAVCVVIVRGLAMLMLKLTHTAVAAGMSLFGLLSSSQTHTLSKLDAMWHMPGWAELPLLPTVGGPPFWGSFYNAPLNFSETLGVWLLAVWVFLVVGLVVAFAVDFALCGSVEMYLLLRRSVDKVDYSEIYYEELEPPVPRETAADQPPSPPPVSANTGTALPIAGQAPPPG